MFSPKLAFGSFCEYIDGKLEWSKTRDKDWTETVFQFFASERGKQVAAEYLLEIREHMNVDYIWRYDETKMSINDILLAVEHEGIQKKVDILVNEEIQHLVDLRARNKIAILYPSSGDEITLLEKIQKKIKSVSEQIRFQESYLIILGYATTKEGKRAIQWKAFFLVKMVTSPTRMSESQCKDGRTTSN